MKSIILFTESLSRLLPLIVALLFATACSHAPGVATLLTIKANIYPDCDGTTIPYNIAPLNFRIMENGDCFKVWFTAGKDSFELNTGKDVDIPLKKWRKLLTENKGNTLVVKIFAHEDGEWKKYDDLCLSIADEPVDSYVVYRLIEPGYEGWKQMGLYQRCLENFEESAIIPNSLLNGDCVNCHSFHRYNPDKMLFHVRGRHGGTVFATDNILKKINTKAPWMTKAGVYPRWHPSGRYVAFSTNVTGQMFLAAHPNKIEVYDRSSDIVMYDVEENRLFTSGILSSPESYETFPEWSPDGRYLYFCTTKALAMPQNYKELKYDLVRVAFDSDKGTFSDAADTLVRSSETGKSVSLPRISPDGKHLVFCMFDYGTFPIWHRESDLYLLNLETGISAGLSEANSAETESYHCWSSNGRWLIFGSRRTDGNYTRLYISYFDADGKSCKPILLPQKNPCFYDNCMLSYNIPEFVVSKVKYTPYQFERTAKSISICLPKTFF